MLEGLDGELAALGFTAFDTAATVRVRAKIVPSWFGQPGGGLRFELQATVTGIRDLVVAGVLQRIHLANG